MYCLKTNHSTHTLCHTPGTWVLQCKTILLTLALMQSIHSKKVSGTKISKISLFRCCYFTQTPMRAKIDGKQRFLVIFIRPVVSPENILTAEPTSGQKLAKIDQIKIAKFGCFGIRHLQVFSGVLDQHMANNQNQLCQQGTLFTIVVRGRGYYTCVK